MPRWKRPDNIEEILEEDDGFWEDERWSPILLTAMSGIEFNGRAIPIVWQIEFEPWHEDLQARVPDLKESGIELDGDGWSQYVCGTIQKTNPVLAQRLHDDSESSTCVIWVESEEDCQALLEATWKLLFAS